MASSTFPSTFESDDNLLWAALDLGSNSFHLLLVKRTRSGFVVRERLKEKVQLLAGFEAGHITQAAQARGLACLARFAQRLKPVERAHIRALGTYALREAANASGFLQRAQKVLQTPVAVISGDYEAGLIYRGVAHHLGVDAGRRLVIDIGGGSTEFALGDAEHASGTLSVSMGCVAFRDRFFAPGVMQAEGYAVAKQQAIVMLRQQLATSDLGHTLQAWSDYVVLGTSGTVESIETVLRANGWSSGAITQEAMQLLESAIVNDRWVIEAGLPGLSPDRTDIFPAGVALLSACFEVLQFECCSYVDVSLLQGTICEHLVGDTQADLREDSVQELARRFAVESAQAARVTRCAMQLYDQTRDWWQGALERKDLLRWAAQLHELGVHISPKHYHRHGAYVVKHAELPGFSSEQQSILSLLIRGHRRSMPGLAFRAFDPVLAHQLLRLVSLLRIAVILQRSHNDADSPNVSLEVDGDRLYLSCGQQWLAAHPLSLRELEVEQTQQATAGIRLSLVDTPG